ncbi:MAG: chloride channel protein [Steroidobacteraceae bacterium]|jgi:H+/Cl- antiporter ClcA
MSEVEHPQYDHTDVPPTLASPAAAAFWTAILLTGAGAGIAAGVLTLLLQSIEHLVWPGPNILEAATQARYPRHLLVLLAAGVLTGAGQFVLQRLTSANGIDITEAITRHAGRLPRWRTLGSALLSVVVVGMGASLGREGAPKQAGAVIANALSDRVKLSDEQRRLLVACGAGAGMAAAYGVPLGGALFALEVLRGVLALRLILPALLASAVATAVSWTMLPNAPTYSIPAYPPSASVVCWALAAGPIIGGVSVGYIRLVAWADANKPQGWRRFVLPSIAMLLLGALSIVFPQLLGNGKELAQLAFADQVAPLLMVALLVLRPLVTILCLGSGVPGGLFTPSLALGALLGGVLGIAWSWVWPGVPPGLFAVLGAAAVLAATTHGPISSVVLIMELTARDRSFMLPLLIVVVVATVVARTLDPRSIYDARLTDQEIKKQQQDRRPAPT